jgi:Flp pilus assembly pilin Flp
VTSRIWRRVAAFIDEFIDEEEGQDLVEYMLLGAFVAIVTMAGLRVIENVIGAEYVNWDQDEQDLWRPPNP